MDTKIISPEMREKLTHPLPPEAVTPHPTKKFLSSIKSIYVTERLNEVFGTGAWKIETNFVDKDNKMIVVKIKFSIPEYGIEYECFGGNDNPDLGDAYKGATTDALTKIASWLGIGQEVFKGEAGKTKTTSTPQKQTLTLDALMDDAFSQNVANFIYDKWSKRKNSATTIEDVIKYYYTCDEDTLQNLTKQINHTYA